VTTLTLNDPAVILQLDHACESESVESPADVPIIELEENSDQLWVNGKARGYVTYNSRSITGHNLEDEHDDERI
jgi:hypothetical protein